MTGGGSGQAANVWDQSFWTDGEPAVYGYFRALAQRLRRVRVCCGDWRRVLTDGALAHGQMVGIFLDPPYSEAKTVEAADLYGRDVTGVAVAAREWALAHGNDPRLRIVLCGYDSEHETTMPDTWRCVHGKATAAFQTAARAGATTGGNQENRHRERVWFSPHCLTAGHGQLNLTGLVR